MQTASIQFHVRSRWETAEINQLIKTLTRTPILLYWIKGSATHCTPVIHNEYLKLTVSIQLVLKAKSSLSKKANFDQFMNAKIFGYLTEGGNRRFQLRQCPRLILFLAFFFRVFMMTLNNKNEKKKMAGRGKYPGLPFTIYGPASNKQILCFSGFLKEHPSMRVYTVITPYHYRCGLLFLSK